MKYILIILSVFLLSCSTTNPDYREAYLSKSHVLDITLPNFLVPLTSYTYTIYTQPHVSEIQFHWYYGKVDKGNLIFTSTLHPLNNESVKNPYELKWGIETDFLVQYSGTWIIVIHTVDMYGNSKLYSRTYKVTSL